MIYITGGVQSRDNAYYTDLCLKFTLAQKELSWGPSMNEARKDHSSCSTDAIVAVFGGSDGVSAIEILNISAYGNDAKWERFNGKLNGSVLQAGAQL